MAPVQAIKAAVARISWQSIDIERELASDGMPYDDAQFDVAVLWNVLHDAPSQAARLLTEAARVASHVLVRDRFDLPSYARALPWLPNLVRHDGVRCDLTRDAFVRFVTEQGLVITALDCDLASEQHRDRSFLALLRRP
jgi:hypothetical protein